MQITLLTKNVDGTISDNAKLIHGKINQKENRTKPQYGGMNPNIARTNLDAAKYQSLTPNPNH